MPPRACVRFGRIQAPPIALSIRPLARWLRSLRFRNRKRTDEQEATSIGKPAQSSKGHTGVPQVPTELRTSGHSRAAASCADNAPVLRYRMRGSAPLHRDGKRRRPKGRTRQRVIYQSIRRGIKAQQDAQQLDQSPAGSRPGLQRCEEGIVVATVRHANADARHGSCWASRQ